MPRVLRQIRIEGNIAYVPLTQGYEAVIDAADVPLVEGRNWFASVERRRDGSVLSVYAATTAPRDKGGKKFISMHRTICGTPDGLDTDHADGDGLNNRRSNLRTATRSQNLCNARTRSDNTSGVKGVHWDAVNKKWRAEIRLGGTRRRLGRFIDLADAVAAYAEASADLHGDFGRL